MSGNNSTNLTLSQLDAIYWNQMAQLAAESVQLTPDKLGDPDATFRALTQGNHFELTDPETGQPKEFGALRMTETQAREFLGKYDILEAQPNTTSGFAGVALRDKDTGQITVAYRSTEPRPAEFGGDAEHDILTNGQIGNGGFAMAQIHDADAFLEQVAAVYRQDGDPAIKLVGYSLSGNIVHTQAVTHPDLVTQAQDIENGNMTLNPTGRGNVGNGTHVDVMNTYDRVLADPWSASIEALPYAMEDPRRQQLIDLQSDAMRVRNEVVPNPADGSASGVYDDPAQRFAYEYTRALHDTSWSLNLLPGQNGVDPSVPTNVVTVTTEAMTGLDVCLISCMGNHSELTLTIPAPGTAFWVGPTGPTAFSASNIVGKPLFDPNSDGANNHSIVPGIDTVAFARVVLRAMPGISAADFKEVLEASGNSRATTFESNSSVTGSEGDTLPKALTTLGKWYGVNMAVPYKNDANGWSNYNVREAYHEKLADLLAKVNEANAEQALGGGDTGHGYLRLDKLSQADIATLAGLDDDLGVRVRFALTNNSPYVLTDTPTEVVNANGQYDLGNFTPEGQQELVGQFVQTMDNNRHNWGASTATTVPNTPVPENTTAPPNSIAPTPIPYVLPDGGTGTAWVTPDRPAVITDEAGNAYQVDIHGNLTRPADTGAGGADGWQVTPVAYPSNDPPLDPDSQAPVPVGTARPTPVATPGVAAVNSMANLILAIQNGNDLSAVLAGMSLVNNLDRAFDGAGNVIPTELSDTLGAVAGGLNLVNAIENGDTGGILVSGIGLINTLGNNAATNAIAGTLGNFAGEMVPYLGVINSLAHGDPIGAVAGYLMMNPATFVFGAIIAVFGGMFADEPDIPVAVGNASAHWDATGGVAIDTTYDEAGGGRTANAWLNNLVQGLQDELATRTDESGRPLYGLDPTRLPGIGYAFDADTGDGYLRLTWTDPDGTPQWRQYDTSGMRNDGQGVAGVNDLARDFFLHASDAILPAWEADTRFQQGGDATAPAGLFTGAVSADGASIARTVLSLGAGATATTLLDLDGDGYLESTQWTASPLLAIDLNGDGLVSAFELVDGRADGDARNSLARLDANGDGVLDAGDPAHVHGGEANPDARPAGPPTPPRTSIPITPFALVPAAAATPARAVTREMIAGADSRLFGTGLHRGASRPGAGISRSRSNHKHIRRATATC